MGDLMHLMIAPLVACMVLVGMLSYLGVHVIARGVIFVDLALAQMAALGATSALLFDLQPSSLAGYGFALAFTTLGAFIFAITRSGPTAQRVPHEAIIGVVYVVASAAALLVANRAPHGAEAIEDVLVGTILWVNWGQILRLAAFYVAIGAFHWFLRDRFMTISLREKDAASRGWNVRWWDFLFYVSFGLAITLAVPIAGVLLVFTFLVVPALVAFLFFQRTGILLATSWGTAVAASAVGLFVSFRWDLPTGPVVVCVFGLALLVAGVVRRIMREARADLPL
ncbi:MAG TPA: iron chelate uptake ABC transporter family permease subunit [Gemmatimonadales bacterium]